jgi:hypothetical protein
MQFCGAQLPGIIECHTWLHVLASRLAVCFDLTLPFGTAARSATAGAMALVVVMPGAHRDMRAHPRITGPHVAGNPTHSGVLVNRWLNK